MRIGVFGGSFDPIHYGHLILAEHCREQADLDQVWFIPSGTNPHKQHGAVATDKQRSAMVGLAIGGHRSFMLSTTELERGGLSYTVDTLEQLNEEFHEDQIFWLMGGDSFGNFSKWREPKKILELAIPLVVNRPGMPPVDLSKLADYVDQSRLEMFKEFQVSSPLIEISSTRIRSRVAEGKSIRYLIPRSVEKYIETQKLYLPKSK